MTRRLAALALATAATVGAADGLRAEAHGIARESGLVRIALGRDGATSPPGHGPGRLVAAIHDLSLPQEAPAVASREYDLPDVAILDRGLTAVLVLPPRLPARLGVVATLVRPTRPGAPPQTTIATATLRTPAGAIAEVSGTAGRLRASGEPDPLPWLWSEQAGELAAGGATAASVGRMAELSTRIGGWLDGQRPTRPAAGSSERAIRDPVDGSAQPWRLHLPAGSGPHPFVLLLSTAAGGKAGWEPPPPAWLSAAMTAGIAVVECYPAGDRSWHGAAARRIPLVLAAARSVADLDPTLGAALAMDGRTPPGCPYPAHAPERPADPAWWRVLPGPPAPPTPAPGRGLATVLDAPFTVVVGTAEHRSAAAANRRLAESFRRAYAAHAHAVVTLLDDTADPAGLAGRNLVLIGNPRSNRVLAALAPGLPFTWDHREVRGPGGFAAMRASAPALACSAALPDGRMALILDGSAPAWGDGLPLDGTPSPLAVAPR